MYLFTYVCILAKVKECARHCGFPAEPNRVCLPSCAYSWIMWSCPSRESCLLVPILIFPMCSSQLSQGQLGQHCNTCLHDLYWAAEIRSCREPCFSQFSICGVLLCSYTHILVQIPETSLWSEKCGLSHLFPLKNMVSFVLSPTQFYTKTYVLKLVIDQFQSEDRINFFLQAKTTFPLKSWLQAHRILRSEEALRQFRKTICWKKKSLVVKINELVYSRKKKKRKENMVFIVQMTSISKGTCTGL